MDGSVSGSWVRAVMSVRWRVGAVGACWPRRHPRTSRTPRSTRMPSARRTPARVARHPGRDLGGRHVDDWTPVVGDLRRARSRGGPAWRRRSRAGAEADLGRRRSSVQAQVASRRRSTSIDWSTRRAARRRQRAGPASAAAPIARRRELPGLEVGGVGAGDQQVARSGGRRSRRAPGRRGRCTRNWPSAPGTWRPASRSRISIVAPCGKCVVTRASLDPRDRLELALGRVGVDEQHGRALEVVDDRLQRGRVGVHVAARRRPSLDGEQRRAEHGERGDDEHEHDAADDAPTSGAAPGRPLDRDPPLAQPRLDARRRCEASVDAIVVRRRDVVVDEHRRPRRRSVAVEVAARRTPRRAGRRRRSTIVRGRRRRPSSSAGGARCRSRPPVVGGADRRRARRRRRRRSTPSAASRRRLGRRRLGGARSVGVDRLRGRAGSRRLARRRSTAGVGSSSRLDRRRRRRSTSPAARRRPTAARSGTGRVGVAAGRRGQQLGDLGLARSIRRASSSAASAENAASSSSSTAGDGARRPAARAGVDGSPGRHRRPRLGVVLEPDQADLAAQHEPGRRRRPASRTASITARTSAADPPSAAWMKLACLSDTHAVPMRSPRRPRRRSAPPALDLAGHRVDEHRAGVLPARLVLAPPAHDLGDLASDAARSPAASRSRRSTHDLVGRRGREPRKRRPSALGGATAAAGASPSQVERRRPSTRQAAMSEPCPPAFIRTAPPIEPGTPTAHSKPVSPAAAVRRASTGSGTPPPARRRRAVDVDRRRAIAVGAVGERDGDARRTRRRRRAGSSRGRRPAPAGRTPARAAATRARSSSVRDARRTAPPGHRPGRSSAAPSGTSRSAAGAEHARRPRRRVERRPSTSRRRRRGRVARSARRAEHLVGQRRDVAAAHRDAHVAGARPRRRGTRPGRRAAGSHTTRAVGWASSTALTTSLPVTPGIGVVPDG